MALISTGAQPVPGADPYGESERELDELYAAITGRKAFSYNPGADPLYRAAAESAAQNGRLAMRDTMGQAAALTGGYGSSYAQRVGQQQYDEYLRSLSEALPQYYGLAYRRYSDEGEALRGAYDLAYARSRDRIADEQNAAARAAAAEKLAWEQQKSSYANLVKLISSSGYKPSTAQLKAAGLSRAAANALRREYLRARGLSDTSGGGGGGASTGGTSSATVSTDSRSAAGSIRVGKAFGGA